MDAGMEGATEAGAGEGAVSGTITLPADGANHCIMIAIDTDATGSNGVAQAVGGAPAAIFKSVSGKTVPFSFPRIPAGNYFLWAFVDMDSSSTMPPSACQPMGGPSTGDHMGYFATGLNPPGSASVSVPSGMVFDFQLGVVP